MGVRDVELAVGEGQRMDVPDAYVDPGRSGPGELRGLLAHLEGDHLARRHQHGEVGGDGAGPGADVEQPLA